jgi:pimeloyl-ACP methyl ester carboxylesterase
VAERLIENDGVALCAEAFGDPADPAILLIAGIGSSMVWWEEEFCSRLAGDGRFVIRYDHRDTGRSITYPHGQPGYTGEDLSTDAIRVLDGFDIDAAHVVGVSAGGGIAQELALEFPDRVRSITTISSSPAVPVGRQLPSPTKAFGSFLGTAQIDWSDADSVVDYIVGYVRMLSGETRPFDEQAWRALTRLDVERARDFSAAQNHDLIAGDGGAHDPLSEIKIPALVIHGTADPMFPLGHGEALAAEIPNARLLTLDGAGHGVYREDWDAIVAALLEHTQAE